MVQSIASASSATQGAPICAATSRVSMSQILGVKKPLLHANSFTGERLPKYGVETCQEDELGKVLCWCLCEVPWGHDIECVGQRVSYVWVLVRGASDCLVVD